LTEKALPEEKGSPEPAAGSEDGASGRERRGPGGWDEVLATEKHLVGPGSEWRSGLYRVPVEQFEREDVQREMWSADIAAAEAHGRDRRTAAQVLAIQRVAEASRLRSIYP
jgi:hypothetical protein